MKRLSLLFCLFAACSPAMDEVAVIRAESVSFNYMDMENECYPHIDVVKGMTLEFAIKAAEHYGIEESINPKSTSLRRVNVYSQDLKGADLGPLKYIEYSPFANRAYRVLPKIKDKYEKTYYYLTFSNLPAIGSEKLGLSGDLPIRVLSCKTESRPQLLQLKKGAQLFLGDLTMTVDQVIQPLIPQEGNQSEMMFKFYSPNIPMEIIGMDFFDHDGKPLLNDKGKPAFSKAGGGKSIAVDQTLENWRYFCECKSDVVNISVQYWQKREEQKLPVPPKVLFYDPDADKIDKKQ